MEKLSENYLTRFAGVARLYGLSGLNKLHSASVTIVGLGGVGSWVAEALARSGVGQLTLIDLDEVCLSNTNRQLPALTSTVGKSKVGVLKERLLDVNPEINVVEVNDFLTSDNLSQLITNETSYVVDAIDGLSNKCALIAYCRDHNIPIITCAGAGGKKDPSQIKIMDLAKTYNDPLVFRARKKLRTQYGFPSSKRWNIPCVFSAEELTYPTPDGETCNTPVQSENLKLDCSNGFGTTTFITGTFAFLAASQVVNDLTVKP